MSDENLVDAVGRTKGAVLMTQQPDIVRLCDCGRRLRRWIYWTGFMGARVWRSTARKV